MAPPCFPRPGAVEIFRFVLERRKLRADRAPFWSVLIAVHLPHPHFISGSRTVLKGTRRLSAVVWVDDLYWTNSRSSRSDTPQATGRRASGGSAPGALRVSIELDTFNVREDITYSRQQHVEYTSLAIACD